MHTLTAITWTLLCVLLLTPDLHAREAPPTEEMEAGEQQLESGDLEGALETFSRLAETYPKNAQIHVRLGEIYLKQENFDQAEIVFKKAKELDENLPSAYVGLGLVYAEKPATGIGAYYNFRRAVGEGKRAAKLDPGYGPAYRLLGEAYERFQENHAKALQYYEKYIQLETRNPDGLYYFGLTCVRARKFDKITDHIAPYLANHPEETRLLPLVAQAYFYQERFEPALEHFERHLHHQTAQERQLYTDISTVASKKEWAAYRALPDPERPAFLEKFWNRRDPDILTQLNERIIEHYRRIWYARTFFSDNHYPWDRRGEVYIRYGEPDFRSRSVDREFVQHPEVEAVRTRMAVDIYGPEAAFLTFTGPVFPVRTHGDPNALRLDTDDLPPQLGDAPDDLEVSENESTQDAGLPTANRNPFEPSENSPFDPSGRIRVKLQYGSYAPLTIDNEIDTVPWETWTYTQIRGGMEITFTDENSNGNFDFAPLPPVAEDQSISDVARMAEYAPEIVIQNAINTTPDYYRPGVQGPALNFYYDLADFRGADGQTLLEVYYGIPPEQVELTRMADSTFAHIQCALALADEAHTNIYRTTEEFLFRREGGVDAAKGAYVPELLKTRVPPGIYELQVQLKDLTSGRTGLYKQVLEVKDYRPERLQISDIQLALAIADTGTDERFRKGDIWISPLPTRAYREDQKVYAYFEIYNLQKDAFSQTRYKAQYTVRAGSSPSIGVFGAVSSGLRALFKSRKPQVAITYEQTGGKTREFEYVEIDLTRAKPGVNALEITIIDLISGQEVSREIRFHYGT